MHSLRPLARLTTLGILLVAVTGCRITWREPVLQPLRNRFGYAHQLRAFGREDAQNYVGHHVTASGGPTKLFTDGALTALFHASQGVPRQLNQLALQALIEAVVHGQDAVDGHLMKRVLRAHPLYAATRSA